MMNISAASGSASDDSTSGAGETRSTALAASSFDDLLREVGNRTHQVVDDQRRWKLLLDGVLSLGANLELDTLLGRIVAVASDLAQARFAALGVLDVKPERGLRTFITHGLTQDQKSTIGDLPTGHGILGLIIDRPEPLRLHDLTAHPESHGFPPNHPPMKSFLGVPVRVRDKVFGNLYLTEKEGGGDFTDQDEAIVVALAAAAGTAIENAALHDEAARRERWLAATIDIASRLSVAGADEPALQSVADRARDAAQADIAWVVVGDAADSLVLSVVSGVPFAARSAAGISLEHSLASEAVTYGLPVSVDDFSSDPRSLDVVTLLGWPRLGPVAVVPMSTSQGVSGALALGWIPAHSERFNDLDTALPVSFAEQAALALEITRAREDQRRMALLEDRDRIARDLHDLVIQRLFAVGLGLQSLARGTDLPEFAGRVEAAVDDIDVTIKDIRRTIFALGSLAAPSDLQAEIERMTDRAAATLGFRPAVSFEGPIRTMVTGKVVPDLLAVLSEALSNVARHSGASAVDVLISAGSQIRLTVSDDGCGVPAAAVESGIGNMRRRAERLGGCFSLSTRRDGGTILEWTVPASV